MKIAITSKGILIYVVSVVHIFLFTYAAVSKILDFSNFQIQIGQSPLLSAFAGMISYTIPVMELALVIMLMLPKYRLAGLYGSFFLMVMFTAYIYIILHFSSFIPCSCGGILEKMSWTQHLFFNIICVISGGLAIIAKAEIKFVYRSLFIVTAAGISLVTILFLFSEDIIQHRNNFVRRFPDHVHKAYDTSLNFNSYYFAGYAHGKIYLGNYTAPLLLTEVDTTLKVKKEIVIKINNMKLPFRSLELRVQSNYFYAIDGTVPCLFRGKTGIWTANHLNIGNKPFANPVLIDSTAITYRTHKANGESILGISVFNNATMYLNPSLLQKQIDGVFDTDGTLMVDDDIKRIVYLYRYRNQFIVADPKLSLDFRGKTIDTVSKAQIKIAYNKGRDEKKLAAPPLTVNRSGVAHNGLLFVHSGLIGKFEDTKMWNQTSVIDVYDIKRNAYITSFYVYNIDNKKMNRFFVTNTNFYALIGTHLVSYKLSDMIMKHFYTHYQDRK